MAAGLPVEKAWAVLMLLVNSVIFPPAQMETRPVPFEPPGSSYEESVWKGGWVPVEPAEGLSERAVREIQAHLALSRSA